MKKVGNFFVLLMLMGIFVWLGVVCTNGSDEPKTGDESKTYTIIVVTHSTKSNSSTTQATGSNSNTTHATGSTVVTTQVTETNSNTTQATETNSSTTQATETNSSTIQATETTSNTTQATETTSSSTGPLVLTAPVVTGTASTYDTTPTWDWDDVTDATIYRYGWAEGEWIVEDATISEYTPDTALTLGDHILYVQAGDGLGTWSVSGSFALNIYYLDCPMDPPTTIAASDGTFNDKIQITWASVEFAESYGIHRSTTSDSGYIAMGSTDALTLSYDDTTASFNTDYFYKIVAQKPGCSDTAMSSYDSGNSLVCPIDPPATVAASDGTFNDKIQITWSSVEFAESYGIYRSTVFDSGYAEIGTSSALSYDDTTAVIWTDYYYKIVAKRTGCTDTAMSSYDFGMVVHNYYRDKINWSLPDTGNTTNYGVGSDEDYGVNTKTHYTNHGNGTVTDTKTGLMWERDHGTYYYDAQGNYRAVLGTWSAAVTRCAQLTLPATAGYSDWRLPTSAELHSLADYAKYVSNSPAYNTTYFVGNSGTTYFNNYWSSTIYAPATDYAWYVSFYGSGQGANITTSLKTNTGYARCVRP